MSKRKAKVKSSQVFLKDKNIIIKIVESLNIRKNETIVEIGGGDGAITLPMLRRGAKLMVFEKDKLLRQDLLNKAVKEHFHDRILLLGDVLGFKFSNFKDLYGLEKIKLVGNIPYHITGMILRRIIEEYRILDSVYLMMQREVALRLIAKPSTKEYGVLTVLVQSLFNIDVLFDIKPGSFYPVPRVTSSFVRLIPNDISEVLEGHFHDFESIVKIAFSSRRKKLKNTLFNALGFEMPEYLDLRAEDMQIDDFFKVLKKKISRP